MAAFSSVRCLCVVLVAGFCLAACGGGGGAAPPAVSFSVTGNTSLIEEGSGSFSVNVAAPSDGSVGLQLSGEDASVFQLTGSTIQTVGRLDFENPRDANGDNVYQLTISASATGFSTATQNLTIRIQNNPEDDIRILLTDDPNGFPSDVAVYGDDLALSLTLNDGDQAGRLRGSWVAIVDPADLPGESDRRVRVPDLPSSDLTALFSPSFDLTPAAGSPGGQRLVVGQFPIGSLARDMMSFSFSPDPGSSQAVNGVVFSDTTRPESDDVNLEVAQPTGVVPLSTNGIGLTFLRPAVYQDIDGDGIDETFELGVGELRFRNGTEAMAVIDTGFQDNSVGLDTSVLGFDSASSSPAIVFDDDISGDQSSDAYLQFNESITDTNDDTMTTSFVVLFSELLSSLDTTRRTFASLGSADRAILEITFSRVQGSNNTTSSLQFVGATDLTGDDVADILLAYDEIAFFSDSNNAIILTIPNLGDRRSAFIIDGAAIMNAPDRVLSGNLEELYLFRLEFNSVIENPEVAGHRPREIALGTDYNGDGSRDLFMLAENQINPQPPEPGATTGLFTGLSDVFIVNGASIEARGGSTIAVSQLSGNVANLLVGQGSSKIRGISLPSLSQPSGHDLVFGAFVQASEESGEFLSTAVIWPSLRIQQMMSTGQVESINDVFE